MENFSTLLVGSAMLAGVAFLSWLVGLLMGVAIGKITGEARGKHQDVDELLARQRATSQNARAAASVAAPGATQG